jgi:hypothetical protein
MNQHAPRNRTSFCLVLIIPAEILNKYWFMDIPQEMIRSGGNSKIAKKAYMVCIHIP